MSNIAPNLSRFLPAFEAMQKECAGQFSIFGDILFVEEVGQGEVKTKSGLVIAESTKQVDDIKTTTAPFCRVLAIGDGHYDEDGADVPVNVSVGDIIMVPRLSVLWYRRFGPLTSDANAQFGITRASEIKLRFNGQEAFDKAMQILAENR